MKVSALFPHSNSNAREGRHSLKHKDMGKGWGRNPRMLQALLPTMRSGWPLRPYTIWAHYASPHSLVVTVDREDMLARAPRASIGPCLLPLAHSVLLIHSPTFAPRPRPGVSLVKSHLHGFPSFPQPPADVSQGTTMLYVVFRTRGSMRKYGGQESPYVEAFWDSFKFILCLSSTLTPCSRDRVLRGFPF